MEELVDPSVHNRTYSDNPDQCFKEGDSRQQAEECKHEVGGIPLGSCGDEDNGIIGNFEVPKANLHAYRLTIAFNGSPLTTKFHPFTFAAKDDVAVCSDLWPMKSTTRFFIQTTLNGERWRYSYYRKRYAEKLRKFELLLPSVKGEVDEESIQALVERTPYWRYIESDWRPAN